MLQALCQLFKAQLLMADDSRQAQPADQALEAAGAILRQCQESEQQQQQGAPLHQQQATGVAGRGSGILAQLRLHHALLRCLLLLSQGSIATLAATTLNTAAGERWAESAPAAHARRSS